MASRRSREARDHPHPGTAGGGTAVPVEQSGRWLVRLPAGAERPLRVWVNGVEQREDQDFVVSGRALEFEKPLAKEGRLGLFRWALIFFGIAGTYRKNDSVDVQYATGGRTRLATGLDIEPPS